MRKGKMDIRTKFEAVVLVVLLVLVGVLSVGAITRTISDDSDNIITFIRNSNGKSWEATGANIQVAIDDLGSNGGSIWLPVGTLEISDSIWINESTSIYGCGHAPTYIRTSASWAGGDMIKIGDGDDQAQDFLIRDLRVHGDDDNSTVDVGIHYGRGRNLHIYNVYQKHCNIGFLWDNAFQGGGDDTIDLYCHNFIVESNTWHGVVIDNEDGKVYRACWTGGYVYGNGGAGFKINDSNNNVRISELEVSANEHEAFLLEDTELCLINVKMHQNSFGNDNVYPVIQMLDGDGTGCDVELCNCDITGTAHSFVVNLSDDAVVNRLKIIGGRIESSHSYFDFASNTQMDTCVSIKDCWGWKNVDVLAASYKHGDTVSYTLHSEEIARNLYFTPFNVAIICYPDDSIEGGSFTIGMKWPDNTTVDSDVFLYIKIYGRTYDFY